MVDSPVIDTNPNRSYVDWAAIFAGAVIASGAMAVLTAFASGLGLSSISVDEGGEVSSFWLIITGLFVIISMVASYMLGGYITGRMRRPAGTSDRDELTTRDGINGLVVWGIGTVVSAFLALGVLSGGVKAVGSVAQTALEATGSAVGGAVQGAGQVAGGLISGAGSAAGGLAQGAGQAAAPSIEQMLPQGLKANPIDYLTDTLLRTEAQPNQPQSDQNAGDYQRQIGGILGNLLSTGEISDADRTWLTNEVATRTGISQTDAQARVNETVERVQALRAQAQQKVDEAKKQIDDMRAQAEQALADAKTKAADAAEKARIAGVLSAFLLAASALVSAAAAFIGAVHGGRHRDEGRIWGGLAYRK
ncbi:hypothetical protein HW571_22745 [Agrobacterium genomosp. 3]|uniref:transforming acidic coiled-coil-containing protein n=1 Tax=Agrobacterium tomkonis TaxID=1183410 RepID=UPI001CD89FF1|nr:hypothetical protein [Agrobacterium tomkonis]MCA1878858.1 hypothetical protein [Agrobacterium tumefaciens]MCA1894060.1 hypothetical protein [Agrobacterium tomkonis]